MYKEMQTARSTKGKKHLAVLPGYKSTNKPCESRLPRRVDDVSRGKENKGKTVKPSKKRVAYMLSPNGSVLDVHCTCFHTGLFV